jgi:LysM repeat protein
MYRWPAPAGRARGSTEDLPPRLIFKTQKKLKIGWHHAALLAAYVVLARPDQALAGPISDFFSAMVATAQESKPATAGVPAMTALVAPDSVEARREMRELPIVDNSALITEAPADGDIAAELFVDATISIYEVREGDTLAEIAEMYGVTANTIKWANDLKGPITKGQVLVILPITGVKHPVKAGDTVASIAKKYGADADEIERFNGLEGVELFAGQIVIVPDGEIAAPPAAKKPVRTGVSTGSSLASTASAAGISFVRPVNGVKTQGVHGHNGIDIGAPVGNSVFAAAGGTVIVAKADGAWNGGYGSYIVVSHGGGVQTLYAHLSSVGVSVGETVTAGETIGAVGMTGKTTGPHLHFEVRGATNPF